MSTVSDDRRTAREGYTSISANPGARVGQRQEETPDQERARLDARQRHVVRGEEDGLAPDVDVGAEDHRQAQDHELDPPAHRSDRRPEGLFQVHQDQHERDEEDDVQGRADGAEAELQHLARRPCRHHLEELLPEAERQADGQQAENRQRDSPAGQGLAVVAARVRQAEAKPGRGHEGLGDQRERQPPKRRRAARWRAGSGR